MPKCVRDKHNWVFTWNSYPDNWLIQIKSWPYTYISCQQEIGKNTKRKHIQGYVQFAQQKTYRTLSHKYPGVHWDEAKGMVDDQGYTLKSDTRDPNGVQFIDGEPKETVEAEQGRRTDIEQFHNAIVDGMTNKEIAQRWPDLYFRFRTSIQPLREDQYSHRTEAPESWFITGKPGIGKTRFGTDKGAYAKMPWTAWPFVIGYRHQDIFIVDDIMVLTQPQIQWLLDILDRYECTINVKYGEAIFTSSKVVLTSNLTFEEIISKVPPDIGEALKRRITHFHTIEKSVPEVEGVIVNPSTSPGIVK